MPMLHLPRHCAPALRLLLFWNICRICRIVSPCPWAKSRSSSSQRLSHRRRLVDSDGASHCAHCQRVPCPRLRAVLCEAFESPGPGGAPKVETLLSAALPNGQKEAHHLRIALELHVRTATPQGFLGLAVTCYLYSCIDLRFLRIQELNFNLRRCVLYGAHMPRARCSQLFSLRPQAEAALKTTRSTDGC